MFSHTWDQNAVGSSVSLGPDSMSASVSLPVSLVLLVGASFLTEYAQVRGKCGHREVSAFLSAICLSSGVGNVPE